MQSSELDGKDRIGDFIVVGGPIRKEVVQASSGNIGMIYRVCEWGLSSALRWVTSGVEEALLPPSLMGSRKGWLLEPRKSCVEREL